MIIKYKYRLYPNHEQKKLIHKYCGNERWLWNKLLQLNISKYKEHSFFFKYAEMCEKILLLKKQCNWLSDSPSQSLQQVARNLDQSLQWHLRNTPTFPSYKKKKENNGSFDLPQFIKVTDSHVNLPKLGNVKWAHHRKLSSEIIGNVKIRYENEKYYIEIKAKVQERSKKKDIKPAQALGVSVCDKFVTTDSSIIKGTPEQVPVPNYIIKKEKSLKRYQKILLNKKTNSKNFIKLLKKIKLIEEQIWNMRRDFYHKLARVFLIRADLICIENSLKTKEGNNFIHILEQKAERYGKTILQIDRHDPACNTCHSCGMKSMTEDGCSICKNRTSKYLNAAINTKNWGYKKYRRGYGNQRLSVKL